MKINPAIETALCYAKHGFYTCAPVGVEPVLESFVSNTLEMAQEEDSSVTEDQVRDYVTARWISIVAEMGA